MNRALVLCWGVVPVVLMSGCSSGAHSAASHPTYLAQASCGNSMTCCIQKFPTTAAESCGATAAEIAEVLNGAKVVHEATETATVKGIDEPEREEDEEGEGEGEGTPEWKKKCMALYAECQQYRWTGNCGDCFRYCEGQRGQWPFKKCRER